MVGILPVVSFRGSFWAYFQGQNCCFRECANCLGEFPPSTIWNSLLLPMRQKSFKLCKFPCCRLTRSFPFSASYGGIVLSVKFIPQQKVSSSIIVEFPIERSQVISVYVVGLGEVVVIKSDPFISDRNVMSLTWPPSLMRKVGMLSSQTQHMDSGNRNIYLHLRLKML